METSQEYSGEYIHIFVKVYNRENAIKERLQQATNHW